MRHVAHPGFAFSIPADGLPRLGIRISGGGRNAQTVVPPGSAAFENRTPCFMATKKTERLTVRWTPKQLKIIKKEANKAGVSPSRYVREVALGDLPQNETDFSKYDQVEVLRGLKNEINMVGNNLNQLARVANQTGSINPDRLEEIRAELYRLKMKILDHLS